MGKTTEMVELPVALLKPYERNAKQHPEEQLEKLQASIREFGFVSPCLIDKEYNIIAGHGRVMAAKQMGLESVPCVLIEGLTEEQRRAYILADNRLTELGGWDAEMISEELSELKENGFDIDLTGFSIDDIIIENEWGADLTEDEFEEMLNEAPAKVERGEIWKLGDHRLMCGDSTEAKDVQELMDGRLADLVLTDPPYNVSLGANGGHPILPSEAKKLHRRTDGLTIENDYFEADEDFIAFLTKAFANIKASLRPGGVFYIWLASNTMPSFLKAADKTGLTIRQQIVWIKSAFAFGRQDYQWRHEPCLYGWKEGAAHYFIDARTLTTVFDNIDDLTRDEAIDRLKELYSITSAIYEKKPSRSVEHPTMKPLPLFKKQIRNSSREGDLVLDIFGGSGTTILAAEEMGRVCYMMEYDPHFCDVIINRWEEQTGQTAERIKPRRRKNGQKDE